MEIADSDGWWRDGCAEAAVKGVPGNAASFREGSKAVCTYSREAGVMR